MSGNKFVVKPFGLQSTIDVRKVGMEIFADFIKIINFDSEHVLYEPLYRRCFSLTSMASSVREQGLKMLRSLLLFAVRLLAIKYEGVIGREEVQLSFTLLRDTTMFYHRQFTSESPNQRLIYAECKTVSELAEVEFKKHYDSLRAKTMRACNSKFLEMGERAKLAARARPGGEDFCSVQKQHVSNKRMKM